MAETATMDAQQSDTSGSRTRWRVTVHETQVLEAVFASSPRPNKTTIQQLAAVLTVKPRQVQVWFQNRRQRWRKDFMEMERARTMHLAEISGKVIDYQGADGAAAAAGDRAAGAAVLPPGWERFLAQPAAPQHPPVVAQASYTQAMPGIPMGMEVASTPSTGAATIAAAAAPPPAGAAPDALTDLDLSEFLAFPCDAGAAADLVDPDMGAASKATSIALSTELSTADLTAMLEGSDDGAAASACGLDSASHAASPAAASPEGVAPDEDTIWLGMEWLLDDPEELAKHN